MPQDGSVVQVNCTVTAGYQYRSLYFKIANLPYSIDPHGSDPLYHNTKPMSVAKDRLSVFLFMAFFFMRGFLSRSGETTFHSLPLI